MTETSPRFERFVVRTKDPNRSFEIAVRQWRVAMCERPGWAGLEPLPNGLHVTNVGAGRLRSAVLAEDGLFAVEFDDERESWQLVLAQDASGAIRAGWERRRGPGLASPPEWAAMVRGLELELDPLGHRALPDFLGFAAIAAAPGLTIRQVGASRASYEDGADHWKSIAKRQAPLLRAQRHALKHRRHDESQRTQDVALPGSFAELEEWVAARADQLVVLPRAVAEAKGSTFKDVGLVFQALEMLADVYVATKKGEVQRDSLKRRCRELGLSIGRSVDPSRAGSEGDEYFVTYKGRRRFLESHIGRGTSRDPRYTMRIYFFYDEEDQIVVVGWLPSHLSNSLT